MNFERLRTKTFEHTLRGALYYWIFCFSYSSYETFINLYFVQIGFSSLQIGILAAAVCTMSLVAAPLITNLADRLKQRKLVMGGSLVLMSIFLLLLGFPTTFFPVFFLYTVSAFFRAPISPLADSLATQMEKKTKASFSTMRAIGSLGGGVAAIGFGFLWSVIGFRTMFLIGGLLIFLAGLASQLFIEFSTRKQNPPPLGWKDFLQNRTLMFVWAATIPIWTALFMSWTFEGIYAQRLGASYALIGLIRGLAILVEVPAMIFSGRLLKKVNSIEIMYGAAFLLAATHFFYLLIPTPQWLPLISILKGIGVGLLIPSLVRAVADQAPSEYASSYQGLSSSLSWGLSAMIGSLLGGLLFDPLGGRIMFAVCAVLTSAAVLILFYFLYHHGQSIQASVATLETIPEHALRQHTLLTHSTPEPDTKISSFEEEEDVIIQTLERRYSRMLDKD